MRVVAFLILGFQCASVAAAISCEQLADIAVATQKLRDQGQPLTAVLAEADKLEASNKLTSQELVVVRQTVSQAFESGSRMPYDLLQACKSAQPR